MTTIGSSLSKADDGTPLGNRAVLHQTSGIRKYLTRAEFTAAVAAERARIAGNSVGVWPANEELVVYDEAGFVRRWTVGTGGSDAANSAASHARTGKIGSRLVTLAADANVVLATTGAPASGTGANGDYAVDEAAGVFYGPKASGAWPAAVAIVPSGGPSLSPYLGAVAGGCVCPNNTNNSVVQYSNARTPHVSRSAFTGVQVSFANWYVNDSNQEVGAGGATSFTAAIEYPAGVYTRMTWSGSASFTAANGATTPLTDVCAVTVPNGALFWVRCFRNGPSGVAYTNYDGDRTPDTANGAAWNFAASPIADLTMGGAITSSAPNLIAFPVAVVSTITSPAVLLLGDSRGFGVRDTFGSNIPYRGELERSVGPKFGYINMARSGDCARDFLLSNSHRSAFAAYCSHVFIEHGVNDIFAFGRSATQLLADIQTISLLFPGKPVFAMTIPPESTSTDGWTTTANQAVSGSNGTRTVFNSLIRGFPLGIAGCFEVADVVESARDSGKWKPGYTDDGVHENQTGAIAIKASGGVDPTVFTR